MYNIVLDTETSGLPKGCAYGRFPHYTKHENYDTARIVSISWIVCKCDKVIQQAYYVIKPDGFDISAESTAIHGITNEYAHENGVPFQKVVDEFRPWLEMTNGIVAHNINFDSNVIMSEFHRRGYLDLLETLKTKSFICTMKKGKEFMNFHKNPKLSELHEFLYNEPITNAHNAQADTYYCYRCFIKMFPFEQGLFFFKNRQVHLTEEQKKIVFENPDKNMLVIACAGSGKCHARDTEILMYDGSLKLVQDIVPGDVVMGDDSTPRNVLDLGRGRDQMYEISPQKGERFTVNSEHILCVVYDGVCVSNGTSAFVANLFDPVKCKPCRKYYKSYEEALEVVTNFPESKLYSEITVKQYLELPKALQKKLKLYSKPVEFQQPNSTSQPDDIVVDISAARLDPKYKLGSISVRQRFLEKLIATHSNLDCDTGSCVAIALSRSTAPSYVKDLLFLMRSLGYAATFNNVRYVITLYYEMPTIMNFRVLEKGEDEYYGFTLDGNHKYYMGNFIITHNTTTTLCRIKHLIEQGVAENSIMLTTFTKDAATDMRDKLIDIMGYRPQITVGTIDGISKGYTTRCYGIHKDIKDVGEHGHEFLKLIKSEPHLISHFKFLFIDEFQDINDHQFEFIKEFYKNGCRIFGVGDDAQNIYTFRGSNISYILNFRAYFDNSEVYKLTYNFRSSPSIVEFANASIEKNMNQIPKKMVAANPAFQGKNWPKPEVSFHYIGRSQNVKILDSIKVLNEKEGIPLHEIAILCPINQPLYSVEEMLTANGIKNTLLDSGKGDVRTTRKANHICLGTIHKSKGLEWDVVFMISMGDDIIPKIKNNKAIEEERRLFYVGTTRAKKRLYILFTKGVTCNYVSRYVSEIAPIYYDFPGIKPELIGKSEAEGVSIRKSVMKLVSLLDGADFIALKESGVLPVIPANDITKTKLYEGSVYKGIIKNEDLFADFGIFVDTMITREAARRFGLESNKKEKYAIQAIAHITLDQSDYETYRVYRANFEDNIGTVAEQCPGLHDVGMVKGILEINNRTILFSHMSTVMSILRKIKENATKYGVNWELIPVFNERFLPEDFEDTMNEAVDIYGNFTLDYKAAIDHIWEVSKCQMIVTDRRRRLLFKNIKGADIAVDYDDLFQNIGKFLDFVAAKMTNSVIYCRKDLKIEEGIFGEADMIVGDTVIDYKVSTNEELDAKWLVQLLAYKTLCDLNKHPINKIGIYNALRGWYYEIDVSSWKAHYKFIAYLLQKREEVIARTSSVA